MTFTDVVGEWLTIDQLYNLPPAGFCNGTGFASQFDVQNVRNLTISGITLAAGASCSFSVSLTLPVDFPTGSYLNEVDQVNATVNGMSISGSGAADTLNVVAAPSLSKSFADDPVNAGSLVTLEFTLSHSENAPADAMGIRARWDQKGWQDMPLWCIGGDGAYGLCGAGPGPGAGA